MISSTSFNEKIAYEEGGGQVLRLRVGFCSDTGRSTVHKRDSLKVSEFKRAPRNFGMGGEGGGKQRDTNDNYGNLILV